MPQRTMQQNEAITVDATIASGAALSGAVRLAPGHYLAAIVMPAAWTAADLTFQGSADGDAYSDIYDEDDAEKTIQAAAARYIVLTPADWCAVPFLKVRSGASASAVNQAAARTITLVQRPL